MLNLKNLYNNCFALFLFAKNGLLTVVNDRAMFFTDFVMGTLSPFIIQLLLWNALFSDMGSTINGFGFHDIIYYYAFALILSHLNNGYGVILTFSHHIKEGKLEVYLTKPFRYMTQVLFTFLGESVLYTPPFIVLFIVKLSLASENIVGCCLSLLLLFFYYYFITIALFFTFFRRFIIGFLGD